jgi:hypothetical protein
MPAIIDNFLNFAEDIQADVRNSYQKFENSENFSLRKFGAEIIDLTDKAMQKSIIHYPHTVAIALIVSTVSSLLFLSLASLLTIGLNIYFAVTYKNLISKSMDIYYNSGCSEWTTSPDVKAEIVARLKNGDLSEFVGAIITNVINSVAALGRSIFRI